jgi:hypothetical protein
MKEVAMSGILKSTFQLFAEWRALLTPSGGGVLSPTAVALLGATGLYGGQKEKDDSAASDANILNTALGGEFGAVAAYQLAADSGLLQKPVLEIAMQFQGQHKAHADLLTKTVKTLGGQPAEPKKTVDYKFPIETLKTQTDVLRSRPASSKAPRVTILAWFRFSATATSPRPSPASSATRRCIGRSFARRSARTRCPSLSSPETLSATSSGRQRSAGATTVRVECATPQWEGSYAL